MEQLPVTDFVKSFTEIQKASKFYWTKTEISVTTKIIEHVSNVTI